MSLPYVFTNKSWDSFDNLKDSACLFSLYKIWPLEWIAPIYFLKYFAPFLFCSLLIKSSIMIFESLRASWFLLFANNENSLSLEIIFFHSSRETCS